MNEEDVVAQPDDDDPAVLAMLAQMTPVERQNWEAMLARAENDEVEEEELQEDLEEEPFLFEGLIANGGEGYV